MKQALDYGYHKKGLIAAINESEENVDTAITIFMKLVYVNHSEVKASSAASSAASPVAKSAEQSFETYESLLKQIQRSCKPDKAKKIFERLGKNGHEILVHGWGVAHVLSLSDYAKVSTNRLRTMTPPLDPHDPSVVQDTVLTRAIKQADVALVSRILAGGRDHKQGVAVTTSVEKVVADLSATDGEKKSPLVLAMGLGRRKKQERAAIIAALLGVPVDLRDEKQRIIIHHWNDDIGNLLSDYLTDTETFDLNTFKLLVDRAVKEITASSWGLFGDPVHDFFNKKNTREDSVVSQVQQRAAAGELELLGVLLPYCPVMGSIPPSIPDGVEDSKSETPQLIALLLALQASKHDEAVECYFKYFKKMAAKAQQPEVILANVKAIITKQFDAARCNSFCKKLAGYSIIQMVKEARVEEFKAFLQLSDPNTADADGVTLLMHALRLPKDKLVQQRQIVAALLENKTTQVTVRNQEQATALHLYLAPDNENFDIDIFAALLKRATEEIANAQSSVTALATSLASGMKSLLSSATDEEENTEQKKEVTPEQEFFQSRPKRKSSIAILIVDRAEESKDFRLIEKALPYIPIEDLIVDIPRHEKSGAGALVNLLQALKDEKMDDAVCYYWIYYLQTRAIAGTAPVLPTAELKERKAKKDSDELPLPPLAVLPAMSKQLREIINKQNGGEIYSAFSKKINESNSKPNGLLLVRAYLIQAQTDPTQRAKLITEAALRFVEIVGLKKDTQSGNSVCVLLEGQMDVLQHIYFTTATGADIAGDHRDLLFAFYSELTDHYKAQEGTVAVIVDKISKEHFTAASGAAPPREMLKQMGLQALAQGSVALVVLLINKVDAGKSSEAKLQVTEQQRSGIGELEQLLVAHPEKMGQINCDAFKAIQENSILQPLWLKVALAFSQHYRHHCAQHPTGHPSERQRAVVDYIGAEIFRQQVSFAEDSPSRQILNELTTAQATTLSTAIATAAKPAISTVLDEMRRQRQAWFTQAVSQGSVDKVSWLLSSEVKDVDLAPPKEAKQPQQAASPPSGLRRGLFQQEEAERKEPEELIDVNALDQSQKPIIFSVLAEIKAVDDAHHKILQELMACPSWADYSMDQEGPLGQLLVVKALMHPLAIFPEILEATQTGTLLAIQDRSLMARVLADEKTRTTYADRVLEVYHSRLSDCATSLMQIDECQRKPKEKAQAKKHTHENEAWSLHSQFGVIKEAQYLALEILMFYESKENVSPPAKSPALATDSPLMRSSAAAASNKSAHRQLIKQLQSVFTTLSPNSFTAAVRAVKAAKGDKDLQMFATLLEKMQGVKALERFNVAPVGKASVEDSQARRGLGFLTPFG